MSQEQHHHPMVTILMDRMAILLLGCPAGGAVNSENRPWHFPQQLSRPFPQRPLAIHLGSARGLTYVQVLLSTLLYQQN